MIGQAQQRFAKNLWTTRHGGDRPLLVSCQDENEQAEFVVDRDSPTTGNGRALRHQAVLFRASHHSIILEGELTRRNVPYVKYGGLKFLEVAHVKDLLSFLRLAENPRDLVAGMRVLQLLPGIGPKRARQLMDHCLQAGGRFAAWDGVPVPAAARDVWPAARTAAATDRRWSPPAAQVGLVRRFYDPLLKDRYDNAEARLRNLEQLRAICVAVRGAAVAADGDHADPPDNTGDFAGPPLLDEDYLILSTIHSAKGLEWDAVYVIHAADGNIPSDMATRNEGKIVEELRLFYVALTRAKNRLCVCWPLRYYHAARGPVSDRHGYAQLTRFLPSPVADHFQRRVARSAATDTTEEPAASPQASQRIRSQIQALWT